MPHLPQAHSRPSPAEPSGHDVTDKELMARVVAGDADAFGRLYDRFAGRAFRVARAISHDSAHAQDAVQDAFLVIWRQRGTYRAAHGSPSAWLLTTVCNRAIDIARSQGRRDAHGADDPERDRLGAGSRGAERALSGDDASDLLKRVATLPDPQRDVIALGCFGELTQAEMADLLGVPENTIRRRTRLALERLRVGLSPRDDAAGASGS